MKKNENTLHIFGGGLYVGISAEIASRFGWCVTIRTGKRLLHTIPKLTEGINFLVGDDLDSLMKEGGIPKYGDIGL